MREHRVTLPELALVAGTRGLIGLGAGLLISGRMTAERRRTVGLALLVAGALSTIPLALRLFRARGVEPHRAGAGEPAARPGAATRVMH
jgi:hypothetical protein